MIRPRALRSLASARRAVLALAVGLLAAAPVLVVSAGAQAAPPASSGGQSVLPSSPAGPLGGGVTAPGGTPAPTTPSPVAPTTTSSSTSSGGISSATAIGIALAAVVIIGGILYAIFRDSRRRTRATRLAHAAGPAERIPGSKRPPKARKLTPAERRRRKRGKAPRRH